MKPVDVFKILKNRQSEIAGSMLPSGRNGRAQPAGPARNLQILGLIALCVAVYSGTIDAPFIFDDFAYIEKNPFIRDFGNFFNKQAALKTFAENPGVQDDALNSFLTRPVSYMTFSLNYYFHGVSVAGYHIVNIAIHTSNVLLSYLLVMSSFGLLTKKHAGPALTDTLGRKTAFITAALFAAHPLMTNSVTYITQRMTSLVAMLYLLSILLYSVHAISSSRAKRMSAYIFSFVSCLAAMLSKETAFTLPIMLLLYDAIFCSGPLKQRLLRSAPFILSMAVIPCNVLGLHNSAAPQNGSALSSAVNLVNFSHLAPWEYLLTQFRVLVFYMKLLFVPTGLSLEHDFRVSHAFFDTDVLLSLLVHICLAGYALYAVRSSQSGIKAALIKLSGFGILWFYISLLVESSIIPMDQIAVEYRTYLPSFGIFLFMSCMVRRLFAAMPENRPILKRLRNDHILWVPVICLLAGLTLARNETWSRPDEFWMQTISRYPKLARPYANLADYYIRKGELVRAVDVYRAALRKIPEEAVLYYELGNVYMMSGDYRSAVTELFNALGLRPDMKKIYDLLTLAYIASGDNDKAYETSRISRQMDQLLIQERHPLADPYK